MANTSHELLKKQGNRGLTEPVLTIAYDTSYLVLCVTSSKLYFAYNAANIPWW